MSGAQEAARSAPRAARPIPPRDVERVRVRVTRRGDSYKSIGAIGVLRQKVTEATVYADELHELEAQVLSPEQALLLEQCEKQYRAQLKAYIIKRAEGDVSPAVVEAHIGMPKSEWARQWPAEMVKAERSYTGPTAESIFFEMTKTERFGVPKLEKLEVIEHMPSPIRAQSEARRIEAATERKESAETLANAIAEAVAKLTAANKRNS